MSFVKFAVIYFMVIMMQGAISADYKRVCYFTNWAQYRSGIGKFMATQVDPHLCTHIVYAFAKVQGNSLEAYEWNDINEWSKGQYEMIRDVRAKNPSLKILLAIGGWNHGSQPFTQMVKTQQNINEFATNSLQFLRANGFDGLDLDWEYPANRGSPPEDKNRFTTLVQTLYTKYANEAVPAGKSRLLLTAAVAAGKTTVESAYDIAEIAKYLDFINLMSYDLFSDYNTVTQHNSPLYKSLAPNEAFNVDYAVKLWLNGGTPPQKLILGMASYGRSYRLANPAHHNIGSPSIGQGTAGLITKENGFLSYYEICDNIQNKGWQEGWLEAQKVPYAYHGDQWVGFDNVKSIEIKAHYIINNGLGGGMFWAVDLDDFRGNCGQGANPLMTTMKNVFAGAAPPTFSPITRPPGIIVTEPRVTSGEKLTSTPNKQGTSGGTDPSGGTEPKPQVSALEDECVSESDVAGLVLGILLTIAIATIIGLVFYIMHLKGFDFRKLRPNFLQKREEPKEKKKDMKFSDIGRLPPPVVHTNSAGDGGFPSKPVYDDSQFRVHDQNVPRQFDQNRLPLSSHNLDQNKQTQLTHHVDHNKPPPARPPPRFPPQDNGGLHESPYQNNYKMPDNQGLRHSSSSTRQYAGSDQGLRHSSSSTRQFDTSDDGFSGYNKPYDYQTDLSKSGRLGGSTCV